MKNRTSLWVALTVLSLSSVGFARSPSALLAAVTLEEAPDPAPTAEPASAPAAKAGAAGRIESAAERRKAAFDAFDIGEVDVALQSMKDLLRECLALSEEECKPTTRAVLYRDVGIILADGKSDHEGGVRAMRQAVRANREITLPDAYRSPKTTAAYDEARRVELGFVPATPAAPVAAAPATPASSAEEPWGTSGMDKHLLVHVATSIKTGSAMASGPYGSDSVGQGLFGLQLAVAGITDGNIALGLMGRVDYKWWLDFGSASDWGAWGFQPFVGGVFGRGTPLLHCLWGGVGFEHAPSWGKTGVAAHALYGLSFYEGIEAGIGVDFFHTPDVFYGAGLTEVLFGVHVGFTDVF